MSLVLTDARLRRRPCGAGRHRTLTAVSLWLARSNLHDAPEWDEDDDEADHHGRRGPIFTAPLERFYRGEETEPPMAGADPELVAGAEERLSEWDRKWKALRDAERARFKEAEDKRKAEAKAERRRRVDLSFTLAVETGIERMRCLRTLNHFDGDVVATVAYLRGLAS